MVPQRRDNPLYRPSVVGGEVTSDDVPSPPPRCDLEAENVGSVFPDGLHREEWRWPVEECHPAAVLDQSFYSYDSVSGKIVGVDASVPTEDEISEAVKTLRRNRLGGASGIRAEHLKGWLAAATRGKMAEEKGEEKTEAEEEVGTCREKW